MVSPAIAAVVDCGVTFPYDLAAGGTLECTYSADLPDATDRSNTATAVLTNTTSFSGSADVLFEEAEMTEIDECIDVYDSFAGDLGQVCYADAPVTFTYERVIGPYEVCGEYEVNNVASFVTNDPQSGGSDSWLVDVNVPCRGCTLTIGYWKNHAGFGPQADMLSQYLPQFLGTHLSDNPLGKSIKVASAGQAVNLLSFRGSNNVFDASNGINKLYAQLLGAKLNMAAGASGSGIGGTVAAADAFLTLNNSLDWNKKTMKYVLGWMSTLDQYNNGAIGPGHCSE
jgi:hypothetical protein